MTSDRPPDLHMLNVVVRDMAASLDFYRRLGIAVPAPDNSAGVHVQLKMPGGFSLELDTAESARLWHAGWRVDPASVRMVINFVLPTRQAVDDRYAELTEAGYRARQPPFDAFWGARYAIVADPDGNDVGLMSPAEESRRTWPPRQSPHPEREPHEAAHRPADNSADTSSDLARRRRPAPLPADRPAGPQRSQVIPRPCGGAFTAGPRAIPVPSSLAAGMLGGAAAHLKCALHSPLPVASAPERGDLCGPGG